MRMLSAVGYRWVRRPVVDRFYDGQQLEALELDVTYEDGHVRTLIRISRIGEVWGAWDIWDMKWRGPFRTAMRAYRARASGPVRELRRLGIPRR